MAVDTASRRYAMMGLFAPHRFVAPVPDGTIAQADRQQFLYGYPGILWSEPESIASGYVLALARIRPRVLAIAQVVPRVDAIAGVGGAP